jgi:Flp pilus assembly protein CpaB
MQYRNLAWKAASVLISAALFEAACVSALAMQPAPIQPQAYVGQEPQQPQDKPGAQPDKQAKSVVVTGTIVKVGEDLVLKDATGKTWRLDAPEKASPFEGKAVKVTGKMDEQANLLHVESIEGASA